MSVPLSNQNPDVLIQQKKKKKKILMFFFYFIYIALDCDDFYCNCFDY